MLTSSYIGIRNLQTHAFVNLTVRAPNAVRCHLDLGMVAGPAWSMVHVTEVVVQQVGTSWSWMLTWASAPVSGTFKFCGPSAPSLFSAHFPLQTSSSFFELRPFSSASLLLWAKAFVLLSIAASTCPLAIFLLLLLRRSMLLRTCCGNSFILHLLRRYGAAPWCWPMLLTCVSAAVQTASGFSCFLIIWVNRIRQLLSAVARTQMCLLLNSIQQCMWAIRQQQNRLTQSMAGYCDLVYNLTLTSIT